MAAIRVSRAESLAHRLEETILGEALRPGERLGTKDSLRRQHRVAPGTLNEAVRLLQNRGVVDARPGPGGGVFVAASGRGTRVGHRVVRSPDQDPTAADWLDVRNALEPLLAAEAAEDCDRTDLAELRELLGLMRACIDDPVAYYAGNSAFHRRLTLTVRNSVLRSTFLTVLAETEKLTGALTPSSRFVVTAEENLAAHRELVDAMVSGDRVRVRSAVLRHVRVTTRLLVDPTGSDPAT